MAFLVKGTDIVGAKIGGPTDASEVAYDNSESGVVASNVQDAIDEVNGREISIYNVKQTVVTGSLSTFALGCKTGFTPFITGVSSTDIPTTGNFQYASGFILKRTETQIAIVMFEDGTTNRIAMRSYYNGTWSSWRII